MATAHSATSQPTGAVSGLSVADIRSDDGKASPAAMVAAKKPVSMGAGETNRLDDEVLIGHAESAQARSATVPAEEAEATPGVLLAGWLIVALIALRRFF